MCSPTMILPAVQVAGQLVGNSAEDKALGKRVAAQEAQKAQIVRNYNYNVQNLTQQQQDQFEQAVAALESSSINAIRNQGMVQAALGETGLEGRSMDSVVREVQGESARKADSIRANFQKNFSVLQQRKEVAQLETQSSLDGIPKIEGPSTFSRILGVAGAGLSGVTQGVQVGNLLQTGAGKNLTGTITNLFSRMGGTG